jgi:hypothetical protein
MPGTVYLLGAGASHDATKNENYPLPLANQFFDNDRLLNFWPNYSLGIPKYSRSALHRILLQYFGADLRKGSSNLNIEEIYSFLESAPIIFSPRTVDYSTFIAARRELLEYIFSVIVLSETKSNNINLHSTIVKKLGLEDSIITFNWDCLIDHYLENNKIGQKLLNARRDLMHPLGYITKKKDFYEFATERLHGGQFIKLHGSVDYAICMDSNCIHYEVPLLLHSTEAGYSGHSCPSCGGKTDIFIVPPHIHKSYQPKRFLRLQVRTAAEKLSIAEKIVIIGYSFPEFDFQAKMMLRLQRREPWQVSDGSICHLKEIILVNPSVIDESWMKMTKDLLGMNNPKLSYGSKVNLAIYPSVEAFLDNEDFAERKN